MNENNLPPEIQKQVDESIASILLGDPDFREMVFEKRPMTEAEKFIELNKIKPFSFDAKINQEFMAKAVELFPERKEAVEQAYGEFAFAMKGAMRAMYDTFASQLRNALGNSKIVFLPDHSPTPSMRNVSKIIVPGNGRKH